MSRAGMFRVHAFRVIRPGLAAGLSAVIVATTLLAPPAVAVPDCLAAPDDTPTEGRRWFYRLDHANNRKCWYLKAPGATRAAAPPAADTAAEPTGSVTVEPVPAMPLTDAPVRAATEPVAPRAALGRLGGPLDTAARDALYGEFLAWRLQQPAD